jgi:hypothetical protein
MSRAFSRREAGFVQIHLTKRVDFQNAVFGRFDLGLADPRGAVDHLPLQVGLVHNVEIDDADAANARRCQIQQQGGTETAGADTEYARRLEAFLPFQTHFGQNQVGLGFPQADVFLPPTRCRQPPAGQFPPLGLEVCNDRRQRSIATSEDHHQSGAQGERLIGSGGNWRRGRMAVGRAQ